jgi:hypothetical protein
VAASQTDAVVIAAVTGKAIRVHSLVQQAGVTETTIEYQSGTSGAISPTFHSGIHGGVVLPFNPAGWFETDVGESLTATTGAGSTHGILVAYSLV